LRVYAIFEVNIKEWGIKRCPKINWLDLSEEEREQLQKWHQLSIKKGAAKQFLYSEDSVHIEQDEQEELDRIEPFVSDFYGQYSLDRVISWIISSNKMILTEDNTTVWEREEVYSDKQCNSLYLIKSQPELLVDILTRAIHSLAVNTVNEIVSSNEPAD